MIDRKLLPVVSNCSTSLIVNKLSMFLVDDQGSLLESMHL